MVVVTGGAGFIGSNIARELNLKGETDILIVDNLAPDEKSSGSKFHNLQSIRFSDYMDKSEFRRAFHKGFGSASKIRFILHQGACSNTLENDGQYMMDNNFTYSKELLEFALAHRIPFIYASSAAVYGSSLIFVEDPVNERPLNIYGLSKLVFDNYVRTRISPEDSTVVGLRYFNVYGPGEQHKGKMASICHQLALQLKQNGSMQLFEGSGNYGNGEQRRDFVFVGDVVKVNLFLANGPTRHGIMNLGSGNSRSFNDVAYALMKVNGKAKVAYIPFPEGLKERYQSFTQADITQLRKMGYAEPLTPLEEGIKAMFA